MRPDCKMDIGIGECKNLEFRLPCSSNNVLQCFRYFLYSTSVKVQAFPTDETVAVQKYDFGDIDHLSIDALHPLSESYRKPHQMVFCARLHGNTISANVI